MSDYLKQAVLLSWSDKIKTEFYLPFLLAAVQGLHPGGEDKNIFNNLNLKLDKSIMCHNIFL